MSKKKMMLVSLVATCCLSILAIVVIVLVTQLDEKKVKNVAEVKTQVAAPTEVEIETEEPPFKSQGIDVVKDEFGTHDIYFVDETNKYNASSGPIDIVISKVQLERFYPDKGIGTVYAEGASEVSIVSLDVTVTNTSNEDAFFVVKSVRGKADSGETSKIDTLLSDSFKSLYAANSSQQGKICFMYKGNPNSIATVSMAFAGAEDTSATKIGDDFTLKIKLY